MTGLTPESIPALHGRWAAGFHLYDYIQLIEFRAGDSGLMVYGHGQAVKFEEQFRYTLHGPGQLRITWDDGTPPRDIGFELAEGPHPVEFGGMGGTRQKLASWRIRFASDPFPPGVLSEDTLLDYYRW